MNLHQRLISFAINPRAENLTQMSTISPIRFHFLVVVSYIKDRCSRFFSLRFNCSQTFGLTFTVWNTEDGNCIRTRCCCWKCRRGAVTDRWSLHLYRGCALQFWAMYPNQLPSCFSPNSTLSSLQLRDSRWTKSILFLFIDEEFFFFLISKTTYTTKCKLLRFTHAKMHAVRIQLWFTSYTVPVISTTVHYH